MKFMKVVYSSVSFIGMDKQLYSPKSGMYLFIYRLTSMVV